MNTSDNALIKDISETEFDEYVIQQSHDKLVLVDFWASWCNPCKLLAPILDNIIDHYNGDVFLAKIDTDIEQALASKYGIRSLPTVAIFKHGEIVDQFMGAIPEGEIQDKINRHQFNEVDHQIKLAQADFNSGKWEDAKAKLSAALKESSDINASMLLAKIHINERNFDEAEKLLSHVGMKYVDHPQVKDLIRLTHFHQGIQENATTESTIATIEQNPSAENYYQLGCLYALEKNYEFSIDAFLEAMKKDRKYKDDGARKNILAIFDVLGRTAPMVNQYRVKMARLLH